MKKLWTLILFLLLITGIGLSDWQYNPFTKKLDYYESSALALNNLTDVNAGAPNNNDVLTWNAATSRWIAQAGGGGAPTGASYLTLGLNAFLTAERVLTAGTGIGFADTGANGTLTVATNDAAIDHDSLLNYQAGQHLMLPGTIAAVLTDHTAANHGDAIISDTITVGALGTVNNGALDADLQTYAGITPSANVQTYLGAANYGAMRTQLGLVIGTNVQAWDADLDTYAGITPSADIQTFLANANFAAMMADLSGTATAAFSLNSQGLTALASIAGPAAALDINTDIVQDVNFWDTIASGNPSANFYGWNTAGGDRESAELTMDDTNDEFLIQVPNSANNEGITVSLLETNQRFRVRQNSDAVQIYHNGTDAYIHTTDGQVIIDTDEAAANAMVGLTESDGTHVVYISAPTLAADWTLTLPVNDGDANQFLQTNGAGVTTWAAGGAATFLALTDTPGAFVANNLVANNGAANALEFTAQLLQSANGLILTHATEAILELDVNSGTDEFFIEASSAEGLANTGLRIVVNEDGSGNSVPLYIVGEAERDRDYGDAAATDPEVIIARGDASQDRLLLKYNQISLYNGAGVFDIQTSQVRMRGTDGTVLNMETDLAAGNAHSLLSAAGAELNDTDARQAWTYLEGKINQVNAETGAAGYEMLKIRVTETDIDTAALNWLVDFGTTATAFGILRDGKIATNQAVVNTNTPSGATVQALPIYDASGTLLGYIPVYAAVW